jgi:hypothetical protein
MDEDIAEQFARRDRFIRRQQHAMTPAERMDALWRMQRQSWAVLSQHPEGLANFMRRNLRKRSVSWRENDAE